MKKFLWITGLSVIVAASASGVEPASRSSVRYESSFESKATSYDGRSYDRRFNVVAEFMPNADITGHAHVTEESYCKYFDEPSIECVEPSAFETHCDTSVELELGKVRIEVKDPVSGETVSEVLPWKAYVGDSVKKEGDKPCVAKNLEGVRVSGSISHSFDLKSTAPGKETSVAIDVEPYAAGITLDDMAMTSTLQKVGDDDYRVAPFTPNSEAKAMWSYTHEASVGLTWGNSGFMKLKLKN
jgi:hypothetical protein